MRTIDFIERSNFGELFWKAVRLSPDKVAIEQDDVTLTYAQLEDRTARVAGLLRGLGVGRDDKVLLMFPNDWRFAECLFGPLRLGAVSVPANIKLGVEALTYIAQHSDSTVLIGHIDLKEKVKAVQAGSPNLRQVLVVGGEIPGTKSYDRLLESALPEAATVQVGPDHPALLMYTSGSTGRPKGCLLSHRNKWWQARSSAMTMLHEPRDKGLVMGPLYHANALWACLLPMLYVGGTVTILLGFDPMPVLAAIDRYRPTFTSGTPSWPSPRLWRATMSPRSSCSCAVRHRSLESSWRRSSSVSAARSWRPTGSPKEARMSSHLGGGSRRSGARGCPCRTSRSAWLAWRIPPGTLRPARWESCGAAVLPTPWVTTSSQRLRLSASLPTAGCALETWSGGTSRAMSTSSAARTT